MSRRSNIARLPAGVLEWLHSELEKSAYGDLVRIANEFREHGWKVSKSALGRYSQKRKKLDEQAEIEALARMKIKQKTEAQST